MTAEGQGVHAGQDRLTDIQVVEGFQTGTVDGSTVMQRFLDKADLGYAGGYPLQRSDGTPFTDGNGKQLTINDYLTVAERHGALGPILGFVAKAEDDPNFAQLRGVAQLMIGTYAPEALIPPQQQ